MRQRGDGDTAFDDRVNQVRAIFFGRAPAAEPGLILYIMVSDAASAVEAVRAAGNEITRTVDPEAH